MGVDRVLGASPSVSGGASIKAPAPASPGGTPGATGGLLTVKVVYFGMPLAVANTKEEYFVLQSPAYFRDLLGEVEQRHPIISTMVPTMIISVNGVPGEPSTVLKEGDEVDLVPATAGG